MATVDPSIFSTQQAPVNQRQQQFSQAAEEKKRLHRIEEVRKQQGISLRSASRQMSTDLRQLREQEKPNTDMRLSELAQWQTVLGVPISELLEEPDAKLSEPIMRRAQLVRVMKTVRALAEIAENEKIVRLSQTLTMQLTEIMPELEQVGAWHSVGQRRSLDEYGRAADRLVSEDMIYRNRMD